MAGHRAGDVRRRFETFAGKFKEKAQAGPAAPAAPALDDDYWQSIQDLFTRDVTAKGLRELFDQEARETYRFFTRDLDLRGLEAKPWHRRYPLAAWRVFVAIAYRLSPWRRILFAAAVPVLVLGWLRQVVVAVSGGPFPFSVLGSLEGWLLLVATLTYFLLVLELRDKLSLKGDLEIARQIQFGLLPFEPYSAGGISVVSAMRPANTVGGDYFDVIELGEGRVALVVGDVAGKGMPAALLMALLQGSLRTLLSAGLRGPELVAELNAHLCANIPPNRLITFFYGELDSARGALRWVNAGHNFPFLLRADGGVARLDASGMALGVAADAAFEERESVLGAGDSLFLFTDGVTEAMNTRDEEYGEERLTAYLLAHRASPQRELIDGAFADVLRFCGSVRPRDDMTVMSVGRAD